jgi:hypothetical protein
MWDTLQLVQASVIVGLRSEMLRLFDWRDAWIARIGLAQSLLSAHER